MDKMEINKFRGFLGGVSHSTQEKMVETIKEKVFDRYEKLMNDNELLNDVIFSQMDRDEGSFYYEGGVKILMPSSETCNDQRETGASKTLSRLYTVKVYEVDRKNSLIKVSMLKAQEAVRPSVIKQINHNLKDGIPFFTQARIIHIKSGERSICFLDILGLGIRGLLYAQEWGNFYVKDLKMYARVGEIIDIAVIGYSPKSTETSEQYICSRKKTLKEDNAWRGIEEIAPLHSNVSVKCVCKREKYFIGKIKGIDEIAVYCQYPSDDQIGYRTGKKVVIIEGMTYRGYISQVSEERHMLRARILDELPALTE